MSGFVVGPETRPAPQDHDAAPVEYWTLAGNVKGPLPLREAEAIAEKDMAAVADPVPLGLVGFASATFTVSTILAGWFSPNDLYVTIPVLLIFGGIAQFLAGMWSYARGNVLGTVAFGSFGSFNAAYALLLWLQAAHIVPLLTVPGSDQSKVAGVFVLMFALISTFLAFAALEDNLGIAAILGFLALAYFGDGTGLWIGGTNWVLSIGGYAGLVSSILAFYVAAAIVVNAVRKREVWPTFSVRSVRQSMMESPRR